MTQIPRIVAKVYGEPWAILPDVHRSIRLAVEAKLRGESPAQIVIEPDMQQDPGVPETPPNVTIIPVHGIIGKHLDVFETLCGGCDLDTVCEMIDLAAADDGTEFVMFDFRSPGGMIVGVPEAAAEIAELASMKTVGAFTDDCCCSAAYWLASQCPSIFSTRSATLGSIGVISVYFDESRALANQGIIANEFVSGKYKSMGQPYRPMTDDEKKMLQTRVDAFGTQFRADILAKRDINADLLQGQIFDGRQALENGMADALVSDIQAAIDLLTG